MKFVLPRVADPEVSIVMATHGAWPLTERALAAVIAHTDRPFELIVVDNASKDETRARLSELGNARVIENESNRGYGSAVNQGAKLARGRYLLLLNTDAFVHSGWLNPLVETLESGGVGAVAPRYLHPDGSLQEAGALLAQDGTVMVYGDGDDPARTCYRFQRTVDFSGAACMLLRRDLWDEFGGFDECYGAAYYEDTDLCMRIAQRGLTVVYEPRSTVTHVRYGSGTADNAAELSEQNRAIFVERWGAQLLGRPPTFRGASEQAVIAARDALATTRILICAPSTEPRAGELAYQMLTDIPAARVTWAMRRSDTSFDPEPWLSSGVEVIDQADPSWLNGRLFHYDLVGLGDARDHALLAALERTQPQAPWISLTEFAMLAQEPAVEHAGRLGSARRSVRSGMS